MTDLMLLICASIGALAFGVLAAYGVLWIGFSLMRRQQIAVRRVPVVVKVQTARVL